LRAIAPKLIEMAEGGDLQASKEVGDDKCAEVVERGEVSVATRVPTANPDPLPVLADFVVKVG
jgi:hypothetical protein